jgi:hypothetical protein
MTFDDQLDWCFRQEQRIRFHVGATLGSAGSPTVYPFDDPRWWRSWMLVGTKHRIDQNFYKHVLATSYPKLFPDLAWHRIKASHRVLRPRPLLTRLASKLDFVKPKLAFLKSIYRPNNKMHVDMDHMFASHKRFHDFCVDNVEDLHKRGAVPWLDLPKILKRAERDSTGLGRPLFALASLEINFKAGHFERSQ